MFKLPDIYYRAFYILLGGVVFALILLVKAKTSTNFYVDPLLFGYTIFITTFELSRIAGAMFFNYSLSKIIPELGKKVYEPFVSFVVPCKNEEAAIEKTVTKCFEADYPSSKIEVIVINDGSTDRTLEILYSIKPRYTNLVIVDWKINKGKRHGMAEGFKRARGEIVVQLDSDSYIDPKTFRELIRPFENPEIGAVCAHADPENADVNMLTKMQTAYYFVSFRIQKAAESVFLTVFCCSGCSSAYRKSIVAPIMDDWLNEKFLGLPVTWGDDRALTNWVLRKNYKTIYTDRARAFTIVPTKFRQFVKQQIRWKKGWFVNSVFASKFILKKQPFVTLTYFFPLILVSLLTPFMAARGLFYGFFVSGSLPVFYLSGIFLMSCAVTAYYRYVGRENKYWPYVFVWAALNMVFLSYVLIYALFRIRDRSWGTR